MTGSTCDHRLPDGSGAWESIYDASDHEYHRCRRCGYKEPAIAGAPEDEPDDAEGEGEGEGDGAEGTHEEVIGRTRAGFPVVAHVTDEPEPEDAPPDHPPEDPYAATCKRCDGWGETLTGSRVVEYLSMPCPDCGGKGYDVRAPLAPPDGARPPEPTREQVAAGGSWHWS